MDGMIGKLFNPVRELVLWSSNKRNRLRLQGARIEIIACVITRNPEKSILLVQSAIDGAWMLPQEGVNYDESFHEAMFKCLSEECSLELPEDKSELAKKFHVRVTKYIDTLKLHPDRWGDRGVVDNDQDTIFRGIKMKKKAYWASIVVVKDQDTMDIKPNGTEIVDLKWYSLDNAKKIIKSTNTKEKSELLLDVLSLSKKHLYGVKSQ